MQIQIATTAGQIEKAQRLRYQTYVEEMGWQYDQADHAGKRLRDALDKRGSVYCAEAEDGRVLATCCLHVGGGGFTPPEVWCRYSQLHLFADLPESRLSFGSRLILHPDVRDTPMACRMLMRMCRCPSRWCNRDAADAGVCWSYV